MQGRPIAASSEMRYNHKCDTKQRNMIEIKTRRTHPQLFGHGFIAVLFGREEVNAARESADKKINPSAPDTNPKG